MRASDISEVRVLRLFSAMEERHFNALMEVSYLQTFPPQLELAAEGDRADFLYIVVEGSVELYACSNARESTMAVVRPIGTFTLAAVLNDAVYLMSARTVQRSRVLLIPSQHIRDAFQQDAEFARAIVQELARCYRGVVKEYKGLKLRTAVERLANRLLWYHSDQGADGSLELPYDKRTLASVLGMTPENLSRAFNTLKPYGVEVNGASIRITDVKSLESLAKPNPLIDDRRS